jgi:hypothetical protein
MTGLAQSNKVIWSIATSLSALQMVNIQNFVSTLSLTMLAPVAIPCKDVFTDIPESHLFALLVLHALNLFVLDLLGIELSDLNGGLNYRKTPVYHTDNLQVSVNLVKDAWCKPILLLAAVIKPWRTIAGLAVSACPTVF